MEDMNKGLPNMRNDGRVVVSYLTAKEGKVLFTYEYQNGGVKQSLCIPRVGETTWVDQVDWKVVSVCTAFDVNGSYILQHVTVYLEEK